MNAWLQHIQNSFYINLLYENRYQFLLDGFKMTLQLTVLTFILGTVIGAVFCQLRLSHNRYVRTLVEWIKTLFVRLPTLVLLIIFAYMIFARTGIDTVSIAILAFALKTGAYISDIMYSALQTVDTGEIEAARTLGMSKLMAFRLIVLPQAVQSALPVYKNQLIITLQETSLVGFLAINDLTRASQVITSRTMDPYLSVTVTAVAYLLIGGLSGLLLNTLIRRKHLTQQDVMHMGARTQ